jgi:hypothetical protein
MSLKIFPPAAEIFPNQKRLFQASVGDLQPMWTRVTNGVVRPDFAVDQRIPSGGAFQTVGVGDSALQLVGGLGSFEFKIDNQSLAIPSGGGGQFSWAAYFAGASNLSQWKYLVIINPTTIEIQDENAVTLATLPHNVAIGDRFRTELGNGFRLLINDVLRHERVTGFSGGIQPPAFYGDVNLIRPSASGALPRIPAPILSGDWQLREYDRLGGQVVLFSLPEPNEGVITGAGGTTEYSDGVVPGNYKLSARIDTGLEIYVEDAPPTGAAIVTIGTWAWVNSPPPVPISGALSLRATNAAGRKAYVFQDATRTMQVSQGDVMTVYVWLDGTNTPTEIFVQWQATDATGFEHRAYWGADNFTDFGVNGTPSRRFMGPLPPTAQWIRLEVPASQVDLEGRVVKGGSLEFFDGAGHFDQVGKYPGIQTAEASITIPTLQITGDAFRSMQPNTSARFPTNYDSQPGIVTWSVVSGGGSFSGDVFTAPSAPGVTVVRASAPGNQLAQITIVIPPIITPNFLAVGISEQIDFDTNIGPKPVFVSAGTVAEGTGNITPGIPAGIQKNDVLLLTVESANESVPTPAGWNIVTNSPQGTGTGGGTTATRLSMFWLRVPLGGIVAAPTITDPGDHAVAKIRAYRNCIETGNPWDLTVGNTAASGTGVSLPGGTTTVPNCLVIQAVAFATDTATPQVSGYVNADLANLTEREDLATTQGNGGGFAIVEGEKAVAGAFGATTATLANASVQARITIALRPALVVWSASAGSMNSNTGVWQAPAVTDQERQVRITVTNGTFTATLDMFVLPLFPLSNPSAPIAVDLNKTVLISISEDRSSYIARVKDKDGRSYITQEVQFLNCEVDELEDVITFWEENYPGKRFILVDNSRPAKPRIVCYFDSNLRYEIESSCARNISFRVREA